MRIMPYIAGAAALSASHVNAASNSSEPKTGGSMFWPGSSHLDLSMPWHKTHRDIDARGVSNMVAVSTRWGKCLDVTDGKFQNGQVPQLWDCTSGPNQGWALSGNVLQTANGQCLDVPSGNMYAGAPLQLWQCSQTNQNQWFEQVGVSLRKKGSNFCLDVKDGHYDNGAKWQLWFCDFNSNGNQVAQLGGPQSFTTQQSPSSFLGYSAISIDRFMQLHPECAAFKDSFTSASAANNLVPVLLSAIAETESSCQERPRNGYGLMQFSDDGAWKQYGDGGDRQKASDAIWAGARYMRDLINQNNQNLDSALRAYNGPLNQGGNPNYQSEIRQWMSGGNPWG